MKKSKKELHCHYSGLPSPKAYMNKNEKKNITSNNELDTSLDTSVSDTPLRKVDDRINKIK